MLGFETSLTSERSDVYRVHTADCEPMSLMAHACLRYPTRSPLQKALGKASCGLTGW
jgi:hypothetical protein